VRALLIWLYEFPLLDCHPGLRVTANFPDSCIFLTSLFVLAAQYNLPQLKLDIEQLFKAQCTVYSGTSPGKPNTISWYFPLLRLLLTSSDIVPPLRDIFVASFRTNMCRFVNLPEVEKANFCKEMQSCPELAWYLLATGGLDGTAMKICSEGKVPFLVKPVVQAAAPVDKITPAADTVAANATPAANATAVANTTPLTQPAPAPVVGPTPAATSTPIKITLKAPQNTPTKPAPAKKSPAKKAPVKEKAPVKKSPFKKSPAKKSPTKKTVSFEDEDFPIKPEDSADEGYADS